MKKIKIKTKIIILYITVLILSFFISFSMISLVNQKYVEKQIGSVGIQTISALAGNLSLIFDNVTQFSSFIYFNDTVQKSLEEIDSRNIDPKIQRTITKSLVNTILSGDYISSAFIFDKYFNYYNSNKVAPIKVDTAQIENTAWYEEMKRANGNGFFIQSSEGVLDFPTRPDKKYISYIREIGSEDTYEPIAILLLTIDAETIQSYFDAVGETYDSRFFIVNGEGDYVIEPKENIEEYRAYIDKNNDYSGYKVEDIAGSKMIMVSQDMGIQDWKLVGSFRIKEKEALTPYYTTNIILIMGINVVFIFICSLVLTKLIFAPLSKVEKHMTLVEEGSFVELPIENDYDEINQLKKVFNHMSLSIQQLIAKVKEEEQVIAKGQLDIMQAQINPHFLYNTLDAVSALALMEDNRNCFKMTQALGSFYRNSLNSGLDFISLEDELQCIKSYITILNIRYEDKIKVEYDVEEEVRSEPVLKLLLQPVVENAVHHGIKENTGEGIIRIKVYRDEDEIIFIVTDNGCGMTEERIEEVMEGRTQTGRSGFGIFSLIQRITLYYHIKNPITIHSETGSGTEVTIRIKRMDRGGLK